MVRAEASPTEAGVKVDWQRHDLALSSPRASSTWSAPQFLHSWGDSDRDRILRRAAAAVAAGGVLLIEGHLDHGPFRHDPGHGPVHLPAPDEVVAALDLGDDWTVLVSRVHPRSQVGPDGAEATRTDSTIILRKNSAATEASGA